MKNDFFVCQCYSGEHTLRFMYDKDNDELYTEVFLAQPNNFFKRCWIAIGYVFGYKCRYGHWDCWMLSKDDRQKLIDVLNQGGKSVGN